MSCFREVSLLKGGKKTALEHPLPLLRDCSLSPQFPEQCCRGGGATVLTHSPAVEFLYENWEQLQKHRFKTYKAALIFYFYLLHVQGCCS